MGAASLFEEEAGIHRARSRNQLSGLTSSAKEQEAPLPRRKSGFQQVNRGHMRPEPAHHMGWGGMGGVSVCVYACAVLAGLWSQALGRDILIASGSCLPGLTSHRGRGPWRHSALCIGFSSCGLGTIQSLSFAMSQMDWASSPQPCSPGSPQVPPTSP